MNVDNEDQVRRRLYPLKLKSYRWRFAVGDRVRICTQRQPFRKRYVDQWSAEIVDIAKRLQTVPITYELRALAGENIKGRFYEQEHQKVTKSDNELFDIDRILKTRKRSDGTVEYLVSFRGYPQKFNSWVSNIVPK